MDRSIDGFEVHIDTFNIWKKLRPLVKKKTDDNEATM